MKLLVSIARYWDLNLTEWKLIMYYLNEVQQILQDSNHNCFIKKRNKTFHLKRKLLIFQYAWEYLYKKFWKSLLWYM